MQTGKWRNKRQAFALASVSALLMIATVGVYIWISTPARSFSKTRQIFKPSDSWVVDRNGVPLESVRIKSERRTLDWIEWDSVSPAFKELLVETEDKRFYSHPGVDLLALMNASLIQAKGGGNRGASTLTMQLVGLLRNEKSNRKSLFQKFRQIVSAIKLEIFWSKNEILEAYVNLVPFRGELVGLHSASLGYFAKRPTGLNREESALLVALIRSPNSSVELVTKRACQILKETNCASIRAVADRSIAQPYRLSRARTVIPVLSKHFIESDSDDSVVQTSLEIRIQNLAVQALREQLRNLSEHNVRDGAVLVVETKTGRVVAYAANGGSGSSSADQTDGIMMRRQAGSTLKPIVYATAFDWRLLEPNSLLDDSQADIAVSQGRVYHPQNYDLIFRGLVSVGDALGSSMNVPAVRALGLVGEPRVLDRMRALGFSNLQSDEYYGPSLALGSVDVSLWELTHAYRKLAPGVVKEKSVFTEATRDSIFNILASPEHRRFTFGMDSLLTLPFAAAVKTGTSKDMRDNWCVGYTPEFTVGVWVGNFNGQPMWNVSGMSGAAPIWRTMMLALHPHTESVPVSYQAPAEALEQRSITRIRYPAAGMLVGLDPDIPKAVQKLPIEIDNPQKGDRIFVNNKFLGQAEDTVLWPIAKGRYRVELKSHDGKVVDGVRFEVR